MVYYVNFIDLKESHRGVELTADGIEDLINQLIHRRDIATVDEVVELEEDDADIPYNSELSDWIERNRIYG